MQNSNTTDYGTNELQTHATASGEYLTKGEIAARLRCTRRTIELWMRRGLPHYKFGSRKSLFKWPEVEIFLSKFRTVRLGRV